MDDPAAIIGEPGPSGAPRRPGRSARPDRTYLPATHVVTGTASRPLALADTPLVGSRSLGPLLGNAALAFKLESLQPTGTWLDRAAAQIVTEPSDGAGRVLGTVGAGPHSYALAAQCARVGRPLVALVPAASAGTCGWLDALGARLLAVETDELTLRGAARDLLAQIGGQYVGPRDARWQVGLREVRRELLAVGRADALLALSAVIGAEVDWLAEAAREEQTNVPLPLDGIEEGERRIRGVVGTAGEPPAVPVLHGGVAGQPITAREAAAAQRLLAREEGIITSVWGAAGLAALIRVVQEDRRVPLRARRLPRDLAAVVIVTHEMSDAGGPALAPGALLGRTVSLSDAPAGLARLLVAPSSAT